MWCKHSPYFTEENKPRAGDMTQLVSAYCTRLRLWSPESKEKPRVNENLPIILAHMCQYTCEHAYTYVYTAHTHRQEKKITKKTRQDMCMKNCQLRTSYCCGLLDVFEGVIKNLVEVCVIRREWGGPQWHAGNICKN